jgi:hypothetical protein
MTSRDTLDRGRLAANEVHPRLLVGSIAVLPVAGLLALLIAAPVPARAVDGCQVLLCLASGNWRGIQQCVPPVQEVLRDLARGRPFPTCNMGTGTNSGAEHAWSSAPAFCPPQYTRYDPDLLRYSCDYDGAISVTIEGALWTRTWWNFSGDAVTEFTPPAKAQLGTWDGRFEADYQAWLATQTPACTEC